MPNLFFFRTRERRRHNIQNNFKTNAKQTTTKTTNFDFFRSYRVIRIIWQKKNLQGQKSY